jgi:hypothetical protein
VGSARGSVRKQNEHESATRESNPIFLAKASQKTRGRRDSAEQEARRTLQVHALRARRFPVDRVKGTAPTPGGQGPATARRGGKREQTARESRAARFGRDATDVASPGALSARRFPATRLREQPRPPAAPVPRQRAAEESENKRRANRGRWDSDEARGISQASLALREEERKRGGGERGSTNPTHYASRGGQVGASRHRASGRSK